MPSVPEAGVPLIVAEPDGPASSRSPAGRLPDTVTVGVGVPDAVIENEELVPMRIDAEDVLVMRVAP